MDRAKCTMQVEILIPTNLVGITFLGITWRILGDLI